MGRRRGRRRFRKTRLLEVLACAQACAQYVPPQTECIGDMPPLDEIPLKIEEKVVTTKRNINRLEQKEYYRLYKWLEEHVPNLAPGVTYSQIADMVRKDCAFDCTEYHVKGGLTTCGLSLPKVRDPLGTHEQIQGLAHVVKTLWDVVYPGGQIPEELKRLL